MGAPNEIYCGAVIKSIFNVVVQNAKMMGLAKNRQKK